MIFTIYVRYTLYLQLFQIKGLLSEYDTIIGANWWQHLTLEIMIALISPYPFLQGYLYHETCENWGVEISYQWNHILVCLSFCRIYLIFRYYLCASRYMNPRSKRVCLMNGCEADHMFALKAIMKETPYTFIAVSIGVSIVLFGYCLKVFDGPLSEVSG